MDLTSGAIVPPEGGTAVITETTVTGDGDGPAPDGQGFHLLVMSLEVFWTQSLPTSGVVTVGRSSKCTVRIDDAMASREHARVHIASEGGVPVLMIEDMGSANKTRVRDMIIKPGEPAAIMPGEAIQIGSTVLMVLQDRRPAAHRRIWSHAYFEARVEEECARAAKTRAQFALARIRFVGAAPWTRVTPVLARELPTSHVFASYGPKDYEILFTDTPEDDVTEAVSRLVSSFQAAGLETRSAVAWYPRAGRTSDALLAWANSSLRAAGPRTIAEIPAAEAVGMQRVRSMATRAAPSNINVLILGESGVGKDVLARLVHQLSPRAGKPFVALNCAALNENLLESELFGHEKNAFTGAVAAKQGLFESADGGTVFLDEIGEMPLSMQARLLQAIERREVRPVGAVRPRAIDVRFLSATNVDIEAAVGKGAFRSDLMFRLNTLTIAIPPLRERKDEITSLAMSFLADACREQGRTDMLGISTGAMQCLRSYRWPGNIRELKNVIDRAVVLCDGDEILVEHLPTEKMRPATHEYLTVEKAGVMSLAEGRPARENPAPLPDPQAEAERRRILDVLDANAWSQTRAAEALKISRRTLITKLERYGIPRPQKRPREGEIAKADIDRATPETPRQVAPSDPGADGGPELDLDP
jgi:DNA-binding NtrC family response regulator